MQRAIEEIRKQFDQEVEALQNSKELEALKIKYLGKKGLLQAKMKDLRSLPDTEKPLLGKLLNILKEHVETTLSAKESHFLHTEEQARLAKEMLDITLPGRASFLGSKHPVLAVLDEIITIFSEMGFSIELSPELESEYYNFEVLNFQPDHPARDMQDTFYVNPQLLLRTHTTSFQGRVMEGRSPPIRVICPGRAYRNESISSRSHVFFHQVDGLYVAEGVTLQDMMATLTTFLKKLFHSDVKTRFRSSYFPFVAPGVEVDVSCVLCGGQGCSICKYMGWLEILGAGMVHPQVLRNVDLDPEKYTGYAWGLGVERIVLLRYGIDDIRLFTENDLRFLSQFSAL